MVKVVLGPDRKGNKFVMSIAQLHKNTLDSAIYMVKEKKFDYIAVIAGLPGVGKSAFSRVCAKYCDPTFDMDRVAFTAEDFIRIINEAPEYSSVILDESFQSMNSRTTMTPEFTKIINYIQIVRQKHLFIFLCLPNFFDLARTVAVFRTHSLFVVYADDEFNRGFFMAFGRNEKRKLYKLGMKFMDYNVVKSNYNTWFSQNKKLFDEEEYERMKKKHLFEQIKEEDIKHRLNFDRNEILYKLKVEFHLKTFQLAYVFNIKERTVREIISNYEKRRALGGRRVEKTGKSAV